MEWFSEWFNSPYYHVLYKNRDFKEAESFIENLIHNQHFETNQQFLDLACGKGRHAIYLNSKGFKVLGLDIAPESIVEAQQSANKTLHFAVHDMRNSLQPYGKFDFILNLFTSFGYFEQDADNFKTIQAIKSALQPGGTLILDFMNTEKVIQNLVPHEVKTIDNITFNITRKLENGFIIKQIQFEDLNRAYLYEERVCALSKAHFENYFAAAGLKIQTMYGNYELDPYDKNNAPRMIFVVKQA
jgi:SAM-dependent methyltransferase